MKRLKYLVLLLLLLPITVFAKTPNKEETIKVIESIENVQVDEGIIIYSAKYENDNIILNINNNGIKEKIPIPCTFDDNQFTFTGGKYLVKEEIKEIETNDYAFYLYSILESKSTIPYSVDNYYNNNNVLEKAKELKTSYRIYIEGTNTFGITLEKEGPEYVRVYYNYYFDGDYPVMIKEEQQEELTNPETGNYSLFITIILIVTIGIGIYTCFEPNKRIKGE